MTTADVINKLNRRFNSFRATSLLPNEITFRLGPRKYTWFAVHQGLLELDGGKYRSTPSSDWVEGIILGKVRDDSGRLHNASKR